MGYIKKTLTKTNKMANKVKEARKKMKATEEGKALKAAKKDRRKKVGDKIKKLAGKTPAGRIVKGAKKVADSIKEGKQERRSARGEKKKLKGKMLTGEISKSKMKEGKKEIREKRRGEAGDRAKETAKSMVKDTRVGKLAGKIKKKVEAGKPKRDALKKERQASRERKKAIRQDKDLTSKAKTKTTPKTGGVDQMAEKTMKKVPTIAAAMYGGKKAPGMYGKGSKISYGHNSGMKMSGYAKAGLAGKGMAMVHKTSANTVLKHGAMKKGTAKYKK